VGRVTAKAVSGVTEDEMIENEKQPEDSGAIASNCSSVRAASFTCNKWDQERRFMIRQLVRGWQVYGWPIEHVAMCDTREDAEMVRDALEALAQLSGVNPII